MERYIDHICCNPASSHSSSSSTKVFCDGERQCSPFGSYRCCTSSLFNYHTYSILKRICHKIIKSYSRQRCRENYSVFDGGNSTSLRSFIKGRKDDVDSIYSCMQTESVLKRNGYRKKRTEKVYMPESKRNFKRTSFNAVYEDKDKRQYSKNLYLLEKNNVESGVKKFQKRKGRNGNDKNHEETVFKNYDTLEKAPKKLIKGTSYNSEEKHKIQGESVSNKKVTKSKGVTENDKDGSKKPAGVNGPDGNDNLDESLTKQSKKGKNQDIKEKGDRKNGKSIDEQTEIESNVNQGGINIYDKGSIKQLKKGKFQELKEKGYRKNKKNVDEQSKIKSNVNQGGINTYEENLRKIAKRNRISELDHYITKENDSKNDKHINNIDGAINKLVKISKNKIGSKEKDNEGYQEMSNLKNTKILLKKNQDDGKGIKDKDLNGKLDSSALGLFMKNSAISKSKKASSGKAIRQHRYADTFNKRSTTKGEESSKSVDKILYSSKGMTGLSRELQSCRYVRPCDILRVKLEERDLTSIACCSPYRSYISYTPCQCCFPCG